MKTTDFNRKLTSAKLHENLGKQFGVDVNLKKYDREQLEDIRNKLRTRIFQQEGSSKINDLLTNETYQKDKAMLELLNTRIKEMLGEQLKKLRDTMDRLTEAKKPDANKNGIPDYAEDGKGPNDLKKSTKTSKAKTCSVCKKPINLCGCKEKKVKEAFPVPGETKEKTTGKFEKTQGEKGTVYKKKAETTKPSKDEKDLDETKAHANDCDCNECSGMYEEKQDPKALSKAAKTVKKGALHKQEGIPQDKKIGDKKLQSLKKSGTPLEKKRANFALNIQGKGKKKTDESQFRHNVRFVNESIGWLLNEDEEGKAKAITAAGDIVNDFTGWMQRVGQYQTKSMIELADAIRADFGAAEAEAFKQTVGPALSASLEMLTQQREAISNAVAVLAGGAAPEEPMGMEPEMPPEEPGIDATAPDELNPEAGADLGDEFAASDAGAGGREMRESREQHRARKLSEAHSIISKLAK